MTRQRNVSIVVLAALLFAAWELVDHLALVNLDIYAHYTIALVAETLLALGAILWVGRRDEAARVERARALRLASVVISSLASEDVSRGPLASIIKAAQEIRQSTQGQAEVQALVDGLEHDARRLQVVNRGLRQAFGQVAEA